MQSENRPNTFAKIHELILKAGLTLFGLFELVKLVEYMLRELSWMGR